MATQVQNRRGSTAEHSTFTGAAGELTVDTDKDTVVVHDGGTAGGAPLMREDGSNSSLALGSAASPSLKWDANTGIYSPGADQVAISTNGTGRLTVSTTAVSYTLAVDHPLGAVGTPSITFTGDLNTGFWSPSADAIAASTGGSERLRITSDGKLGLGTSEPQQNFDLAAGGDGNANGPIFALWRNSASPATSDRIGTIHFDGEDNAGARVTYKSVYGQINTTTAGSTSGSLVIGADTTTAGQQVIIDSSGRLLIGTSSESGGSLLQVNDNRIRIATAKTPASATDTGVTGEMCWDANYVYVCTATNTWKRTAIATW